MKTALANASRTCPAWCTQHDADVDVCLSTTVIVDIIDGQSWMADALSVGLGFAPGEGLSVGLAINHVGPYEVPVADARRFAEAILEQCRQAEAGLIPGPRTAPEGESLS